MWLFIVVQPSGLLLELAGELYVVQLLSGLTVMSWRKMVLIRLYSPKYKVTFNRLSMFH